MKVLFINTPTLDQPLARDMAGGLGFDRGEQVILPPLDLAYQAAALRAAGHGVDMVDPDAEGWSLRETLDRCRERQWDTAICAASLPSIKNDCRFIRTLREESGRPILLHTNVTEPDAMRMMLENSGVEFGLFGECEILLDPILSNQTREATFRLTGGVLDSPGQPRVQDLDRLPFPARDLLPNDRYRYFLLGAGAAVATVQTSRGCPFKCAYYCPYPLVQGKTWRARSADNVIEELREIRQRFGISNILFRDAVFTLDQNRSREICERMVTAGLSLRWWCETRADLLDEPLLRIMRQAGCAGINIGVETGDPEVLRTEAKVGLTPERLAEVVDLMHRIGIQVHFLLMVGLPSETRESLYMTYDLIRRLRPDSIGVTILTPYPGTPLYKEAREKGWLESTDWNQFGGHAAVLHTDHLSAADLRFGRESIEKLFHLQRNAGWWKRRRLAALAARFRRWTHGSAPGIKAAAGAAGFPDPPSPP